MTVQYEFGPLLRAARERRGLTHPQVAGSIPLDTYLKIEVSTYIPGLEEAQLILEVLGIKQDSPEYLDLLKTRTRDRVKLEKDPARRSEIVTPTFTHYTIDRDGNVTPVLGVI